jgi:hypothetical protein
MPTLTIICAWCRRVVVVGNPELPVSHGLCAACYAAEMAKLKVQA